MNMLSDIPTATITSAGDAAARAIPPLWPLASSVAVNPFLGQSGETLAQVRARISCGDSLNPCSSIKPSMDIEFDDVWTDEGRAGRPADPSFDYAYIDLTTTAPTSPNCITQGWSANCRAVINYEMHIHPLWDADRPVIDPATGMQAVDPVTLMPLTNNCTNCHTLVDEAGADRVPDGQLDLTDGLDILVPEHFNSYEELLSQDDRLTLDANDALTVELDANGQPMRVDPSMNALGANASNRF